MKESLAFYAGLFYNEHIYPKCIGFVPARSFLSDSGKSATDSTKMSNTAAVKKGLIMTYDQFIFAVQKKVEESIGENVVVSGYEALKNNGTIRRGLSFIREEINISPAIFLEEYYRQFCAGASLESVTGEVLKLYREVELRRSFDENLVKEYEEVGDRIIYRLVNRKSNADILKEIPHRVILDLAVIYLVLVDVNDYGTATMLIRREHQKLWGVSEEELYARAKENTPGLLKKEFREMKSVLEEMTGIQDESMDSALYVLTNHIRSNGAGVILYEGCLEQIGCRLGENFYALPSSIHEWIMVPQGCAPSENELSAMVKEINETQVEPEEILSDHAYFYDREKNCLSFYEE